MAKNRDENTGQQPNSETPTTESVAAPTTVAEAKSDERFKMVTFTNPQTNEPVSIKRIDLFRGLWKGENVGGLNPEGKKWSRGDIARKASELTGKKIIYQVVNAAVKGIPGGPDKTEKAAPAAAETPAT